MAKSAHKNQLAPGISRLSRSKVFSKRAAYKIAKESKPQAEEAQAKGEYKAYVKNDLVAALTAKSSDFVPATVVPKAKATHKAQ
ncbi:hypothetical protein IWW50_004227, partial [Coemansia erecta]